MKLFMITVLPLSLAYMMTQNNEKCRVSYVSVLTGLVLGAFYSFIECMFTSSYYLIRYAFFPNYGFYLLFEVILPCLFCTFCYFIFIKKPEKALAAFYFVLAAFYAVYMPARIIHRGSVFGWYLLFVKPVLYTAMLIGFQHTALLLSEAYNNYILFQDSGSLFLKKLLKHFGIPAVLISAVFFIPPAVDVMHLLNLPIWTILPAALIYCIFALTGIGSLCRKKKRLLF